MYGEVGASLQGEQESSAPRVSCQTQVCVPIQTTRPYGMEVALEALREGLRQKKATLNEIQRFARVDRVERIMQPYLEALA